jgi:hypothetical protein
MGREVRHVQHQQRQSAVTQPAWVVACLPTGAKSNQRSLPSCCDFERYDVLAPILAGLFGTVLTQGRVAEALPWAQEMLDLAEVTGDADLLIAAHASACEGHFWPGELTKAVEHADNVLDRYDDETHRHLADILNQDPKTSAGIFASICTWMLGYPDRALRLNDGRTPTPASVVTPSTSDGR